jgi:hypothetical protein
MAAPLRMRCAYLASLLFDFFLLSFLQEMARYVILNFLENYKGKKVSV